MEHISASYPEEEWTQVCTNGSATEATRDGCGDIYIKYKAEEAHLSVAAGWYATNYKAEAMALNTAAAEIVSNLDKTRKCVFFSDDLLVLDALQNQKRKGLNNLTSILLQQMLG